MSTRLKSVADLQQMRRDNPEGFDRLIGSLAKQGCASLEIEGIETSEAEMRGAIIVELETWKEWQAALSRPPKRNPGLQRLLASRKKARG